MWIVATMCLAGGVAPLPAGTLRSGAMSGATGSSTSGASTGAAISQTSTAATEATAQAAETTAAASHAQAALISSMRSFQAMTAAQAAARNLVVPSTPAVPNGLTAGGLVPQGGLTVGTIGTDGVTTTYALPNSWTGVSGLTEKVVTSSPAVVDTVTQNQQQALLYWDKFNIGKSTTLNFDQSAGGSNVGNWVAINRVAASVAPSQVLGSITAQGQVYVINQNGIIFGGSSQVNVGALVASSLPINDNLAGYYDSATQSYVEGRGLLNNPDFQFLFTQANIAGGSLGPTPGFTPPLAPTSGTVANLASGGTVMASGQDGDVIIQAGAQISTPAGTNGKVALVGTNVGNAGTISTPDGQTILAAGQQVGFEAHPTSTSSTANPGYANPGPSFRGLDTYVGTVRSGGTAVNSGLIEAPRAEVTIVGKAVDQFGVIDSSTSVSFNGRIDLLADYGSVAFFPSSTTVSPNFYPTLTGTVTLGAGSLTQILPELASTDTIVGSQLALNSQVNLEGANIEFASGSTLYAPGAQVTANAGNWIRYSPSYVFASTGGGILFDSGATLDVSGLEDVTASVQENIVTAQLLGAELSDSPLQRDSPLRGQTVTVDIDDLINYDGQTYVGTALADLSGYANLVQHSVGELTTNGGTVALNAGGGVTMQAGSTINISGGWIDYQGANVTTTKVISNGQILDISKATPDQVYQGIYTGFTEASAKYGISQTSANSLLTTTYEAGYVQGGSGGSISIVAPVISLGGSLYGNTVAGSQQRSPTPVTTLAGVITTHEVPAASSLSLSFQNQVLQGGVLLAESPAPVDVVFQASGGPVVADPFASGNTEFNLSADLVNVDGFGNLNIVDNNSHASGTGTTGIGNIVVPGGTSLVLAPGGSLVLDAANIDIEGEVIAPGGTLSFTAENSSPLELNNILATPAPTPGRGQFTLGAQGLLDASGLVVDDRATSSTARSLPMVDAGGTISISGYNVDLATGSMINVSGGVALSAGSSPVYGAGGGIALSAGQDPKVKSILGGQLQLGAQLLGYSGAEGGSLSIVAPLVQVGGNALINGDTPASGNTLWINRTDASGNLLAPDFFSQGGFASFSLNGFGQAGNRASQPLTAMTIAPNTVIVPRVESLVVDPNLGRPALDLIDLPAYLQGPVSLSFGANGVINPYPSAFLEIRGDLVMGTGSQITLNPNAGSKVNFSGNTVALLGTVSVPGGTISVAGGKNTSSVFNSNGNQPLATVDLGPSSILSTAGATVMTPNAFSYRTGTVLNGGTISVTGNIVAEQGSVLDVSGAADLLSVTPTQAGGSVQAGLSNLTTRTLQEVDSNGGTITLTGGEELYAEGTLKGGAGSLSGPGGATSAMGGSLALTSGIFLPLSVSLGSLSNVDEAIDQTGLIVVTPDVSGYALSGTAVIGTAITTVGAPLPDTRVFTGYGHFAASSFNASGLDNLTLNGSTLFSGSAAHPVTLTSNGTLRIASGGIVLADDQGPNGGVPVKLNAPYVDLGTSFTGPITASEQASIFSQASLPLYFSPTWGLSSLQVTAQLIDLGNLSLQSIGTATFTAANGDIRGDGTLDVAGNIVMTAGQVYPTTEGIFTIAAYDPGAGRTGSISINASGTRELPYSAGGTLNLYGTTITQDGVLRAPIGTINLGWDGTGSSPIDFLSGAGTGAAKAPVSVATTQQVTLASSSETSVTAVDATLGALTLPYGTVLNGVSWIDPAGTDITTGGVPGKTIAVSAANVTEQAGATLDISGGGDLYAYDFVTGTGGTHDVLASSSSFAVIPGYQAAYAPSYSSTDYSNGQIAVGQRVYLSGINGLPAQVYTLLPARYALLPGAFLVTPSSSLPLNAAATKPDGSSLVSGYLVNGLNKTATTHGAYTTFLVDPPTVVRAQAEYDDYSANTFLKQSATASNLAVPRLPIDAGQVVLAATSSMNIDAASVLRSQPGFGGQGGLVDLASPNEIDLLADGVAPVSGALNLDASTLEAFSAASLLIGGYRSSGGGETSVTVTTSSLNVGSGVVLDGSDIVLVSKKNLTIADGAQINAVATAGTTDAPTLVLGTAGTAGSGDGVLVRVSADPLAAIQRLGLDSATGPNLVIGNAILNAASGSLTLDSTSAMTLSAGSRLQAASVAVESGHISLELDNAGALQSDPGLVISSSTLQTLLSSAQALSLLSYSAIDIYGTGTVGTVTAGDFQNASLALHAADLRGFNTGAGTVTFNAQSITIDNSANGTSLAASTLGAGTLAFNASTVFLGNGTGQTTMGVNGYANLAITASNGIMLQAATSTTNADGSTTAGVASLSSAGSIALTAPLITAATAANVSVTAGGDFSLAANDPAAASTLVGGLGATAVFQGATLTDNGIIRLKSGNVTLAATTGALVIGGTVDVSGKDQTFSDVAQYTSGGSVILNAGTDVTVGSTGLVNVAAPLGGGNGGTVQVTAGGTFNLAGTLAGTGGAVGQAGQFSLDAGTIAGGNLAPLQAALDKAGFTHAISIRDRTDATVTTGSVSADAYALSADQGSILVNGTIDAHNVAATDANGNAILVGGTIGLSAGGSVTLGTGAVLNASGQTFNTAGQGGTVTIGAGNYTTATADMWNGGIYNGTAAINLNGGLIDLSVADVDLTDPAARQAALAAAAVAGQSTGTLHLRAPQIAGGNGVAVSPLATTINSASSIVVEGFSVQDAKSTATVAIDNFEAAAQANAVSFTNQSAAIQNRLLAGPSDLSDEIHIRPGEEIDNSLGGLILNKDWDLSTWRYGTKLPVQVADFGSYQDSIYFNGGATIYAGVEPGDLTIRAAQSITFNGSLTDGFGDSRGDVPVDPNTGLKAPWLNTLLPAFQNGMAQQSWSFVLTGGADFAAASPTTVMPLGSAALQSGGGSIQIGKLSPTGKNIASPFGVGATTASALVDPITQVSYYQVVRTGTGDITLSAGRDVQLLNQFATVYTAGTQAASLANFDTPQLYADPDEFTLLYPAQYSQGGGNVTILAQGSIAHLAQGANGLIADSERELPENWLYRRGAVDANGDFATALFFDTASTSWWTDFSNFFEGVGALGGGNVTLRAGANVSNVDAVVPTNARTTNQTASGDRLAADQTTLELGGGNLSVLAGNNIDAGVYYVERGQGTLHAGNQILTNATRAPSLLTLIQASGVAQSAYTYLPTTLFLGKGGFDVSATGNVLLGPVANAFLLPQGIDNTPWYKTYFSTYGSNDTVQVSSLDGSVTLREDSSLTTVGFSAPQSILQEWFANVLLLPPASANTAAYYQPWLNLAETNVSQFNVVSNLLAPSLAVTAFSGDIDQVGSINLSPSATGTVDFLTQGSINAFQPDGTSTVQKTGKTQVDWASGSINLSDADPAAVPGVLNPYAYQSQVDVNGDAFALSTSDLLDLSPINSLFAVSGSIEGVHGVVQTQEKLHVAGLLHASDPNPAHLYAKTGSISGLNLFSAKAARVEAGDDISDIAFYIQNVSAGDVTVIAAGGDITAYDPNSALRLQVDLTNSIYSGYNAKSSPLGIGTGLPNAGDIQIAGPGTLEVLAGHNLNLGVGPNNSDGTGVGISSIGGSANPFLPVGGADIVVGAGVGDPTGFNPQINFGAFVSAFLDPATAGANAPTYLADLPAAALPAGLAQSTVLSPFLQNLELGLGLAPGQTNQQVVDAFVKLSPEQASAAAWTAFQQVTASQQNALALTVFFDALRDSGRSHNSGEGDGYASGMAAIATLFPPATASTPAYQGDISLTSREIKTTNGGNISLLAPGGQLTVGYDIAGNQPVDQGILTEDGGNISIFTNGSVNVGTSRIFTLHGGNEIIWSTFGDIAAGASSKTVQSAPPTRVLVDPQSGGVQTDLAGLATGGGIGVLETVAGAPPADVDLIAPNGTVNAGDAGIRVSGNLNIAAVQVVNAGNIQVGGKSNGVPTVAAPSLAGVAAASSAGGAANSAANQAINQNRPQGSSAPQDSLSIITIEVVGYGGGDNG